MSLQRIFHRCENQLCPNHRQPWRALFRRSQGISLHGRWHCSLACFEKSMSEMFARLLPTLTRRKPKDHRLPLGLLMLSRGLIRDDKLKAALKAQRESGSGRVGEWLQHLGAATEQQITTALGMQWSCPVFPLESHRRFLEHAGLVPFPVLQLSHMVPVHYLPASRFLYVAFADGIDYPVLYAIEQMLECHTEPCLADQSSLQRALEELRRETRPAEILFTSLNDPQKMASKTRTYAAKLDAREVQMVGCGEHLWVRLETSGQTRNLLFQPLSDVK